MTAKSQTPKPEHRCIYCDRDQGSKFALKRHKESCRDNPANRRAY